MKKTNLLVFNGQSEKLLTVLSNKDNDQCPFYEPEVVEQLNKDFSFQFNVPSVHEDSSHLVEGNLVAFMDLDGDFQLFQIYRTEKVHGSELETTVFCEHAFYELHDDIVKDLQVLDGTATEAVTKSLSSSRWVAGTVDSLGTGTVAFYYSNGLKNLQETVAVFGGELKFRITIVNDTISQRLVDLKTRRGADTGKRFEFDKDMTDIKRTVQVDGLKTALYGRGNGEELESGGYSRKITFADIEWSVASGDPANKPLGQEWIGDPTSLAQYGRVNGTRHKFGIFDVDSIDPETILLETWNQLKEVCIPKVSYEMTVLDLESLTGYEHEKVRLGDTIFIIDKDLGLRIEARVLELKRDLVNPENTEVTLGNFIDNITDYNAQIEEIQAVITDRKGVWDNKTPEPIADGNIQNVTPVAPASVTAKGLFKSILVAWTFDPSILIADYELFGSKVNNFTPDSSNLLFRGKSGGHVVQAGTNETWYFRVRAVNPHGVASPYTIQFSASTVQIATPDYELLSITNAIISDVSADKMTVGTLDAGLVSVINLNANNINAGKLKAQFVEIGATTTYSAGYDPTTKATPAQIATAKAEAIADAQIKADKAEADAVAYADGLKVLIDGDITAVETQISDLNGYVDGAFEDGVIEVAEAKAIQKYLNTLNATKSDLDKRYDSIYVNADLIGTPKTDLLAKKNAFNTAHTNLINSINTAITDGKTTATESTDVNTKFTAYNTALANLSTSFETGVNSIETKKTDTARTSAIATASTDATTKANQALATAQTYADTKKTEAISASNAHADAKAEAERVLAEAYADGIVSAEETARIAEANAKLATAQAYADTKKAEAITASEAYARLQVTNLVIGGRNLLSNSLVRNIPVGSGSTSLYTSLVAGQEYTFSCDYEIISGTPTRFLLYPFGSSNGAIYMTFSGATGKLQATFTPTSTQVPNLNLYGGTSNAEAINTNVTFRNLKLEKGNKATDYSKSQEDIQQDITDARTYAETKATEAKNASEAYALAKAVLAEENAEAYADGIVTAEETARIADANAKLVTAKAHADTKATEAQNASKTYSDLQLANLEIGGRNLWKDSNYVTKTAGDVIPISAWGGMIQTGAYDIETPIGLGGLSEKRICTSVGTNGGGYHDDNTMTLEAGVYTISYWAKGDATTTHNGYFVCLNSDTNAYLTTPNITVTTAWKKYSHTITVPTTGLYKRRSIIYVLGTSWISHFKLEKGSKATDWTQAPEDIADQIAYVESRVSDVEFLTTEDSIISTVIGSVAYTTDQDTKANVSALDDYTTLLLLGATKDELEKYADAHATNANTEFETVYYEISRVEEKADKIDFKFSSSGGVNLLKNSVGYSETDFWTVSVAEAGGTWDSLQNDELVTKGVGSGFLLQGVKLAQTVVNSPQIHTLSAMVRKGATGTGFIRATYDNGTVKQVDFTAGVAYDYELVQLEIEPVGTTILIEIFGGKTSDTLITGLMFNVGQVALQWQHSAGEVYNTNVRMDLNGIRVNSNTYNGYTAITPSEFAGYAEVNGTMERVFTLNKDVTEMSKVKIENEMAMSPIKIVPVVSATYNGWAFIAED